MTKPVIIQTAQLVIFNRNQRFGGRLGSRIRFGTEAAITPVSHLRPLNKSIKEHKMTKILLSLTVAAAITFASISSANAQAPGWGYGTNNGNYGGYQTQYQPQYQSSYQPQYRAHSRSSGHYDYQPSSVQQHRGHYDYVPAHYDYHRNRHSHW